MPPTKPVRRDRSSRAASNQRASHTWGTSNTLESPILAWRKEVPRTQCPHKHCPGMWGHFCPPPKPLAPGIRSKEPRSEPSRDRLIPSHRTQQMNLPGGRGFGLRGRLCCQGESCSKPGSELRLAVLPGDFLPDPASHVSVCYVPAPGQCTPRPGWAIQNLSVRACPSEPSGISHPREGINLTPSLPKEVLLTNLAPAKHPATPAKNTRSGDKNGLRMRRNGSKDGPTRARLFPSLSRAPEVKRAGEELIKKGGKGN